MEHKAGLPGDLEREHDALDALLNELLDNQGPDAGAGERGRDAGSTGDEPGAHRRAEGLLELKVARDDGLLDGVVRVDH